MVKYSRLSLCECEDIAFQARMQRHWTPPIGAVLGFWVGMIVKQLIG